MDADIFRPERWLDTDEKKGLRMGWDYLPFSGGPRVCPGRKYLPLTLLCIYVVMPKPYTVCLDVCLLQTQFASPRS